MDMQTLQTELTQRAIILSVDTAGKLKYQAPKGAMTPDLAEAIKAHRAALLPALASQSTEPGQDTPPALHATRTRPFTSSPEELTLWTRYYRGCAWYVNTEQDTPSILALDYATGGDIPSCCALGSMRLIWFYERCESQVLKTVRGMQALDPRQFTELLRTAYQTKDLAALLALAANFNDECGVSETRDRARILFAEKSTQQARTPAPSKGKGRAVVYVDLHAGRGLTASGQTLTFSPDIALHDLARSVLAVTECDRLYICGNVPDAYEEWLTDARIWEDFTTGKRGLYLDQQEAANHVARYQHRETGNELEVRTLYSWFGDTPYTIEEARAALALLNSYLKAAFTPDAKAYATPALTFQQLWNTSNRIHKRTFAPLPADIRTRIRKTSGQGRVELCTKADTEQLPGLYYYDGIFMYAALTWGMPTGIAAHDEKNEYAGKTPARYRIRYTVPVGWQHLGLFMTPREQLTGNERDSEDWCYPGEDAAGRTFETWVDGSELDVAYTLPEGLPTWPITILERIVYSVETDKKPLEDITKKLTAMREKVEQDTEHQATDKRAVYQLVRGAIRNILLHGIGSFNRKDRDVTYITKEGEPAPDNATGWRTVGELNVYTVPQATESYTQQLEHPEWCALVWARCRARMIKAALSLPREQLVAIRTDALAVTHEQPQWKASTKRGSLREKWHITKKLPAPHTFETLDGLVHKYVGEER